MNTEAIEKTLREIIARRVSHLSAHEIALDAPLQELGVDSLAFSWILADMEEEFEIEMNGSDILKLKTLALAVNYIETTLSR